jgi:hypothetical protein
MLDRHHIEDVINNMLSDINYIKLNIYECSKRS